MKNIKQYYCEKHERKINVTSDECKLFLNEIELPCLTTDVAAECDGPITKKDIQLSLQNMENNKRPGNDSLPKEFLRYFFRFYFR